MEKNHSTGVHAHVGAGMRHAIVLTKHSAIAALRPAYRRFTTGKNQFLAIFVAYKTPVFSGFTAIIAIFIGGEAGEKKYPSTQRPKYPKFLQSTEGLLRYNSV